jgi:hypothetical protein
MIITEYSRNKQNTNPQKIDPHLMLFCVNYKMTINRLEKKNNGLVMRLSKYSVTFVKDLFFN